MISIEPSLVRKGNNTEVVWDTNGNNPVLCTVTGTDVGGLGVNTYTPGSAAETDGRITVVADGPTLYRITCGTESAESQVDILPLIHES